MMRVAMVPISPSPDLELLVEFLRDVADQRAGLERLEYTAVHIARRHGATWEDIGEALGISRQAAASRFSKPKARRRV